MPGNANSGRRPASVENKKSSTASPYVPKKTISGSMFSTSLGHNFNEAPDENSDLINLENSLNSMPGGDTKQMERDMIGYRIIEKARANKVPPAKIKEWEIQLGLVPSPQNNQNQTQNTQQQKISPMQEQILQMIQMESDPAQKKILSLSLIPGIDKNPVLLAAMMKPEPAPKDNSITDANREMQKLVFDMAAKVLQGKDDKDKVDEFKSIIGMMKDLNLFKNGSGDSVDNLLETLEKGKKLGIVQDPTSTLEEKKLDIEEKKIDNDYKKFELEKTQKAESDQAMMDTAGKGINTIIQTVSALANKGKSATSNFQQTQTQNQNQEQQSISPNPRSVNVACQHPNCANKPEFLVVIDKPKTFSCPHGCGSTYQTKQEKDDPELTVYTTPQTEATLQSLEKGGQQPTEQPQQQTQSGSGNLTTHLL